MGLRSTESKKKIRKIICENSNRVGEKKEKYSFTKL